MEFRYIQEPGDIKRFIKFSAEIYRGNPHYRDSMSDIVKMFLYKKTSYLEHGEVNPFWVEEQQQILLRGAFITDAKNPGVLMIAFFEAREGVKPGVDLMLAEAKKLARVKDLQKIIVGLDAHLNYGVGFLASHFNTVPCFGFGYTPSYYLDYFAGLKEHRFTSFTVEIEKFDMTREKKILERVKSKGYNFRFGDFNNLSEEIAAYTKLNNECFTHHLWWADRTFQEDWELLYPFRWFIKGENLIIAEKEGKPIGFMLWYPDYNQLIRPGGSIGVETLLKTKLGLGKTDRIKIAEIAIKPEYQGTGVILGLFDKLYSCTKGKYTYCEAGWVEENNIKSKGFGIRWCEEYKRYKAFEVTL